MGLSPKELGREGEKLAAEYLRKLGYKIIEQNYRYSKGEIDIIAEDPEDGYTVFVEVKTRQNLEFGEPEYAMTERKKKQVRKIAELYLYEKEITEIDCRFDVVAIMLRSKRKPSIRHYKNAFV